MEPSSLLFWISKGGIIMWILLAVSIAVVALAIERVWYVLGAQRMATRSYRKLQSLIHRGAWQEVTNEIQSSPGALTSAVGNALHEAGLENISPTQSQPGQEFRSVDRGLWLLGFLAESAPLLGLLGTIFGMIKAFQKIQMAQGVVDPQQLAGGIWEALLTTGFGLIVAIPALGIYHFLDSRIMLIESMAADLTDHAVRVFTAESRRQPQNRNGESS